MRLMGLVGVGVVIGFENIVEVKKGLVVFSGCCCWGCSSIEFQSGSLVNG